MPGKNDYIEIEGLNDLVYLVKSMEVGETKKIRIDPKINDGVMGNAINMMTYLFWEFHQKHDTQISELGDNYFSFKKLSPSI